MPEERWAKPTRWTYRGEAMLERPGRQPLLVWGGIPGEDGLVRLSHRGRHELHGLWQSAEKPDPHRVHPPCERYSPCGGCPLMHVDDAAQEQARRGLVRRSLDDAGLHEVQIGSAHPCPDGLADFRYVVKVGVDRSPRGRVRVGAFGRRTREVVPIPRCTVAAPVLNRVMVVLAHHVIDLGLEPYDPRSDRGLLRAAVLRASRCSGDVLVTLVAARNNRILEELAERIAQGANEVVGVGVHFNDQPSNALFQRNAFGEVGVKRLVGRSSIEERIGDVMYRIGPGDFFQTNPSVAEQLYRRVIQRLDPTPHDTVVDLYCGVGGIALQAAPRAGFVVGVEEVAGAIERARESAHRNRLTAEFVHGQVAEVLPELARRLQGVRPLVVVDPARRGLEDGVIESILQLQPRAVAYVSCNPKALARDLARWVAGGLQAEPVELFDMFPNTPHVESLTLLRAPSGGESGRRAPRRRVVR